MSDGIDEDWTIKKKIQIGWKIVNIIIDKALSSGIKPPRVERRQLG